MLPFSPRSFIKLILLLLLSAASAYAQGASSGRSRAPGGTVDVTVRFANGRPAPDGILVRLESAEGGAEADLQTRPGGKCQFHLGTNGVFMVRIADSAYKEVSERVEIIGNPMAYVVLTLIPIKTESDAPVVIPTPDPAESVSVKDLKIPDPARQEFSKGEDSLSARSPDEAIKHFEKAIRLYPDYPQAYRLLGEAYLQKEDWSEAETALKRSIELEPKLAASYLDLGGLRNQTKDYPGAEDALKKCLDISPNTPAAQYELARTYMATGRWQAAAPLAESAVKELPDLAAAHVLLANIRLKQRNGAGALHEYQEYLRLEPNGDMAAQVRDMVAKLQGALPK